MLFLDADAATDIKDVIRLEKALDMLTTDHVSAHGLLIVTYHTCSYLLYTVCSCLGNRVSCTLARRSYCSGTCTFCMYTNLLPISLVLQRSFFRNILMYGFHVVVYILCVQGIKDTQCGFKMLTRSAAATLFQIMHIDRWAFDVELLYIAQKLRMPIKEVAVNWQEIEGTCIIASMRIM